MKHNIIYPNKRVVLSLALLLSGIVTSQAQVNASLGNLPAGDSVVLYFDAVVNNPLPAGTAYIATRGTVSGGNFANVLTDDPATGGAPDSTLTIITGPLPVTLVDFKALESGSGIQLVWNVSMEQHMNRYEVEKSQDGIGFNLLGTVAARNGAGAASYEFPDAKPFAGNNFYRLRMVDEDGTVRYAPVVRINRSKAAAAIAVFPNPVAGSVFTLQCSDAAAGAYELLLYSNTGAVVLLRTIEHRGGSASYQVPVQGVAAGIYQLSVKGNGIGLSRKMIIK